MRPSWYATTLAFLALSAALAWGQQGVEITQGPQVEEVSNDSARINWETNVPAQTLVRYGTDPNNLNQQATVSWTSTSHSAQLQDLQPGTTYYYQVTASLPGRYRSRTSGSSSRKSRYILQF